MREREQGRKEEKGGKVDMKKVASFPSVLFGGAISSGLFLPPETRRSRETLSKLKKPDLVEFKKTFHYIFFFVLFEWSFFRLFL